MDDKLIKEIKCNVAYIWIKRPDKKNTRTGKGNTKRNREDSLS